MSLGYVPSVVRERTGRVLIPVASSQEEDVQEESKLLTDGLLVHTFRPLMTLFLFWGFATALWIPTGWRPDEDWGSIVGPFIVQVLPVLAAYMAGVAITPSGGVVGAAVVLALCVSDGSFGGEATARPNIFLPVVATLGFAAILHLLERGMDMVVDMLPPVTRRFPMWYDLFKVLVQACYGVAVFVALHDNIDEVNEWLTERLGEGLDDVIDDTIPAAHLFIEPAKVLFANQDTSTTLFTLGLPELAANVTTPKTLYLMMETNPGPGFGALLAMALAGPKSLRVYLLPAMLLHLVGGIHEIYFPFVYARPLTLLGIILGGMAGTAVFQAGDAGFTDAPSPGSVQEMYDKIAEGDEGVYTGGFLVSVLVSWLACTLLLAIDWRRRLYEMWNKAPTRKRLLSSLPSRIPFRTPAVQMGEVSTTTGAPAPGDVPRALAFSQSQIDRDKFRVRKTSNSI